VGQLDDDRYGDSLFLALEARDGASSSAISTAALALGIYFLPVLRRSPWPTPAPTSRVWNWLAVVTCSNAMLANQVKHVGSASPKP
jgi:hypothetical protein